MPHDVQAGDVQIGTILMSQWPPLFGVERESYSGDWSIIKALDGFALDRRIRAAGWNFFFIASEVKAMFPGSLEAKNIRGALHRILGKVSRHHFNALEVTGIVAKRFLGLPYTIVSAHSRHVQQSCYLDSAEARQSSEQDAAKARG